MTNIVYLVILNTYQKVQMKKKVVKKNLMNFPENLPKIQLQRKKMTVNYLKKAN